MSKTEFTNGMLVRIDGYDYKSDNGDGTFVYFLSVFDKNGCEYTIRADGKRLYQIDETSVMPIREDGGIVLFPLKDFHRPHTTKFYVDGRYLERVNDGDELDEIDDEFIDTNEDDKLEDDDNEPDVEVNNEDDTSDSENKFEDPDPEGAANWSEIQEFAKISRHISNITEALAEVTESLTAILKNRMAR